MGEILLRIDDHGGRGKGRTGGDEGKLRLIILKSESLFWIRYGYSFYF
jgi:hypothetical protein